MTNCHAVQNALRPVSTPPAVAMPLLLLPKPQRVLCDKSGVREQVQAGNVHRDSSDSEIRDRLCDNDKAKQPKPGTSRVKELAK